jgi:hypothetical protein
MINEFKPLLLSLYKIKYKWIFYEFKWIDFLSNIPKNCDKRLDAMCSSGCAYMAAIAIGACHPWCSLCVYLYNCGMWNNLCV